MNYQEEINRLFREQSNDWSLLRNNVGHLGAAKYKTFEFSAFRIKVQFNPERIKSSSAKVDKTSIEERPCFLCKENRPVEQHSLAFDNYEFLCNPYPIFPEHYTITKKDHQPQQLKPEFKAMLKISKVLPDLVLFYNGPKCGASAPDHMHFQAGSLGFLPIEEDLSTLIDEYGEVLEVNDSMVVAVDDTLRKFLYIETDDQYEAAQIFEDVHSYISEGEEEPMMNVLMYYLQRWKILIFLRKLHRPWQYFEEGSKNILLSPASVDLGGVLITPLEKDFEKITKENVVDILHQVNMDSDRFSGMIHFLKNKWNN